MIEIWKDIPGWEGYYQACNLGLIRSLSRTITRADGVVIHKVGRVLSCNRLTNDGHVKAFLSANGVKKEYLLHRLVMLTFKGASDLVVNHLDNDKSNNRLDNLEYVTQFGNVRHAIENGYYRVDPIGEDHPNSKFTEEIVRDIIYRNKTLGISAVKLAEEYKVHPSGVYRIISRKAWSHVDL